MKSILFIVALCASLLFATAQQIPKHCIDVKHTYYELFYDTLIKGPVYGVYVQTKEHTVEVVNRKEVARFRPDPLIPIKYQVATDREYSMWNKQHTTDGKKRDKGHLNPYTAFAFNSTAALESMYFTNTAPQASFFNEHQWERIEQYILKSVCPKYGDVKVYTGVIYGPKLMNHVHEPDYYWKIIFYTENGVQVSEAWLGKNDEDNRSTIPEDIVSNVTTIEKMTGLEYK